MTLLEDITTRLNNAAAALARHGRSCDCKDSTTCSENRMRLDGKFAAYTEVVKLLEEDGHA